MKRIALITGVGGGIGSATAQLFSQENWTVFGVDRQSHPNLTGVDHYLIADISQPEQITTVIKQIQETSGRLDTLINNAAMQICKPVLDMEVDEWDQVMEVNVRAAFIFAQEAYPLLKASQGSIVNVSSVHAIASSANIAAYAASKGALTAFTRALAIEWARDQIRVNAILPGAVDTSMLRDGLGRGHLASLNVEQQMKQLAQKTVLGKIGQPSEIAQAILFLADAEKSSFMTGQNLVIDGGATARLSTE